MRALCLSLIFSLCSAVSVLAGSVTGSVVDAETGEPLTAASVVLGERPLTGLTDAQGRFLFADLTPGTYDLTVTHVGYRPAKRHAEVGDGAHVIEIALQPTVLRGQTVTVTATRALARETPVTFSNISKEEIRQDYFAQDVPMLLQSTPSAYAYSDAGNGIGYSYLKIRGFNQQRINVLINGIPHNGPTSHEVYWIDMPDLLANAEDVQIQRGVGSSAYGSSALGGTVNVITANYDTEPRISLATGFGSYNTEKYSFSFNSGLVDESYVMYGRFSRITSDGYRDQSWTKLWSYFLGVTRYDENMTTTFQVYGGPEQTHLAYYGIPQAYLDGEISGDPRKDRKYNPLTYEDELDNFNQPHYELHHDWQLTDAVQLRNTLYTIKGRGNYDQFRRARSLEEFRLPALKVKDGTLYAASWYDTDESGNPVPDGDGYYTVTNSDLIKSRWVDNNEFGWLPKVTLDHPGGQLTLGGETRWHRGRHWGMVTWLSAAPQDVAPDHVYYSYRERKLTLSAFAQERLHLTDRITLMADLQGVSHTYTLDRDTVTGYEHETTFRWLSPRAGVNVNLTDHLNVFANVAYAEREPASSDLVNPQEYWDEPKFRSVDPRSDGTIVLSDPTVKPERLVDIELGIGLQSRSLSSMVNLYHMDFRNEIVPWAGQISEASGLPVTGNADRSVHQGIELEATVRPIPLFRVPGLSDNLIELSGNLNVNNDHFVEYTEYATDWDTWESVALVQDGNRIAGFPAVLANADARLNWRGAFAGMGVRYVGRQYLDNSERRDRSIDPHTVADLTVGYRLERHFGVKGLEVRLQVNNLFDTLYESAGYMGDVYAVASEGKVYGTPYYIPAATRNWAFSLRWDI